MEDIVLIVGASGRLGRELVSLYGPGVRAITHAEVDITDALITREKIFSLSPRLIINCAAITNVDAAEQNPGLAFNVNALGARNLADIAREIEADLVYISTDYVFDGRKARPYAEDDPPNPVNHYGRSKLTGEYISARLWDRTYIIRTGILYGRFGSNYLQALVDTLTARRSIAAVSDQAASPTSTFDLALAVKTIAASGRYGIYHAVNEGRATRCQLAEVVRDEVSRWLPEVRDIQVKPISLIQAGKIAPRPGDTTLSCAKLRQELAYSMRNWEEPVREYVKYYLQQEALGRISGVKA